MLDSYDVVKLNELCETIRQYVYNGQYDECIELIHDAMSKYPDAPHPHNLLGIVLEKKRQHSKAMSHFRAAYALDPSYKPAKYNLQTYGTFYSIGKCAFSEEDLPYEAPSNTHVVYNEKGVGYIVTKNEIQYDNAYIGRVVRRA